MSQSQPFIRKKAVAPGRCMEVLSQSGDSDASSAADSCAGRARMGTYHQWSFRKKTVGRRVSLSHTAPPAATTQAGSPVASVASSAGAATCDAAGWNRLRSTISDAQTYEHEVSMTFENQMYMDPSDRLKPMPFDKLGAIATELQHVIPVDKKNNTVTLSKADIETLRDPRVLQFLAQTPGFAQCSEGEGEDTEWQPSHVFITCVDDDGAPEQATIEDESITYSVGNTPLNSIPPTPAASCVASAPTTPSSAAGTATSRGPSFARPTLASHSKARDLVSEKREKVRQMEQPAGGEVPDDTELLFTPAVNKPRRKKDPAAAAAAAPALPLTSRRVLSEEEERRVAHIEGEQRYDAPDVAAADGEGFLAAEADCERERRIAERLTELRPDRDVSELLKPADFCAAAAAAAAQDGDDAPEKGSKAAQPRPRPVSPVADADERERQATLQRAREASLALRTPVDYLAAQKERRARRAAAQDVNRRLSELYEAAAVQEEQTTFARQSDEYAQAYKGLLQAGQLQALLREASAEQGVALPLQEGPDCAAAVELARPVSSGIPSRPASTLTGDYVDPYCVQTEGADTHPMFSGSRVDGEDTPLEPEVLFFQPSSAAAVAAAETCVHQSQEDDLHVSDHEDCDGDIDGDGESDAAAVHPARGAEVEALPVPAVSTPRVQEDKESTRRKSDFFSGNWDALLKTSDEGSLYRPASRAGTPLTAPRPSPCV